MTKQYVEDTYGFGIFLAAIALLSIFGAASWFDFHSKTWSCIEWKSYTTYQFQCLDNSSTDSNNYGFAWWNSGGHIEVVANEPPVNETALAVAKFKCEKEGQKFIYITLPTEKICVREALTREVK